jgi:hypothetical protein
MFAQRWALACRGLGEGSRGEDKILAELGGRKGERIIQKSNAVFSQLHTYDAQRALLDTMRAPDRTLYDPAVKSTKSWAKEFRQEFQAGHRF